MLLAEVEIPVSSWQLVRVSAPSSSIPPIVRCQSKLPWCSRPGLLKGLENRWWLFFWRGTRLTSWNLGYHRARENHAHQGRGHPPFSASKCTGSLNCVGQMRCTIQVLSTNHCSILKHKNWLKCLYWLKEKVVQIK